MQSESTDLVVNPDTMLTTIAGGMDGNTLPEKVDELQKLMLTLPQVNCEVLHKFSPGMYIRELSVPAGTMAIGHYQKKPHLNVFLKGKVTVLNDDGTTTQLVAPMQFISQPGRKIGYVEEDMVWQNIYPTEETDVEKLEAMFLDKSEDWKNHIQERINNTVRPEEDIQDYFAVLEEFGISHEQARSESERTDNMIELPYGTYKAKLGDSIREGKGLFATANIYPDEIICPGRIGDKRTIAGRYINHSKKPNAKPVRAEGKNINIVAIKFIGGAMGGSDGDEITIDYRESLKLAIQINSEN